MLADTSLTNTLNLSGISNIKYRAYTQSYTRESILSYMGCKDLHTIPSYIENHQNSLINAYHRLISLNIPSHWHITSQTSDSDTLTLELWIFWFDHRHTGTIDNSNELKNLQELRAGSFNWKQLMSNGLSPSDSPQPNNTTFESTVLTSVKEYKLFINSIRNLIQYAMIMTRSALPLGEFFIFPDSQREENIMIDPIACQTQSSSTILACMYNIYFNMTNLVFQPNTRRIRIRSLNSSDALLKNVKVLLCPSGEHAKLVSFESLPTPDLQHKVLKQWAEFYRIPVSQLSPTKNEYLPSLVTIRTTTQDTIVYPIKLVFVPTDTKRTPAALAGMNGTMGFNHGLIEDLGSKVSRLTYYNHLKSNNTQNEGIIDYWSYVDPVAYAGNVIMQSLSMIAIKYQQDQMLLQRALVEPVVGSPIMNSKTVVPFHYGSPAFIRHIIRPSSDGTLPKPDIDLNEFAQSRFQVIQESGTTPELLNTLNPMQDPNVPLAQNNTRLETADIKDINMIESEEEKEQQGHIQNQDILAAILSEDAALKPGAPIEEEDYPMGGLIYELNGGVGDSGGGVGGNGGGDPWDTSNGLGDFDLDVTEADFDFFETPAPAIAAPSDMTSTSLDIMAMDAAKQSLSSPIIKDEDVDMEEAREPKTNAILHNNESLFTPFVISNNGTENQSIESSTLSHDSFGSTSMMQQHQPPTSAFQHEKTYKSTTEQQFSSIVPDSFLPVPVSEGVNDAKYGPGGKFMYMPTHLKKKGDNNDTMEKSLPLLGKALKKGDFNYSPDYVPNLMATAKKKTIPKPNPITAVGLKKSVPIDNDIHMMDVEGSMNEKKTNIIDTINSESSSNCSSSTSSTINNSTSSSSSSTASSDDNDANSSDDESRLIPQEDIIDKRLKALKKFQKRFVNSLLKATSAPLPTPQNLDYDTPFAPILADGLTKPIKWRQSRAMEQSIDYLCQQAVWGGYPFASGLAEVSQYGGEIETEPAKVMAARRTNLMQVTRGAVTHVPSLQTELNELTIDFKTMLKQIFVVNPNDSTATNTADGTLVSEDLSMMTEPLTYLNSPLLEKIEVEGPLSIQKYCNLNEIHSQTQLKYGKYQIKKKRPNEPNLAILKQPDIVVSRHDDFLEGSPDMIQFWEKLGLEPYSMKKHINYFVVYPDNIDLQSAVIRFFQDLNTMYDLCHLGRHEAGHAGTYHHGLVPVPLKSITKVNEPNVKQRLRNYEETCIELGRSLANMDDCSSPHMLHTVIYIVNPGPHMSSYLDMCRCFYKLKETYEKVLHQKQKVRLVLQLIPIEHILRKSSFGGYAVKGMRDIAFSVYNKCFSTITRKTSNARENSTTYLYTPPFVLAKPVQKKIDFKLNSIRAFPVILNQHATLHMAYCFSYDRAWMSVVWVDDHGELLEYELFSRKSAHKDAWKRTLEIAKRTEFPWTIVIAKIGLMFNDELVHWLRYTTSNANKYRVAIIGVDMESGLNLHFQTNFPEDSTFSDISQNKNHQISTFLDASGNGRLMRHSGYQHESSPPASNVQLINNQVQILVLNHRVSYSHKRDRAYKGILRLEAVTEKENWMMPLATGYLIQHSLPNKSVNPCVEQFNNAPFIAEIHLLYNRTHHSAYSALHDIIKKLYDLSFINPVSSDCNSCVPYHIVLAERLGRLLLVIDDSTTAI